MNYLSHFLDKAIDQRRIHLTFYSFLLLHLVIWSLLAALIKHSVDFDMVQQFVLGQDLQWSYHHPPLSFWLPKFFFDIVPTNDWSYYILSQFGVCLAFIGVWKLATEFLPPAQSLLSVILLELIPFYNFHALDLDADSVSIPSWIWTILFFYYSISRNKLIYWAALGFVAAIAMLAKYFAVVLLVSLLMVFFLIKEVRQYLLTLGPYVALFVFLLTLLPHILWIMHHSESIDFLLKRTLLHSPIEARLDGVGFFVAQIGYLAILLITLILIIKKLSLFTPIYSIADRSCSFTYLWIVSLVPWLLSSSVSVIFGMHISSVWGIPIWSTIVIFLFQDLQLSKAEIRKLLMVPLCFLLIVPGLTLVGSSISPKVDMEKSFPSKELSTKIHQLWHDRYHRPLRYVAGDSHVAYYVAFYMDENPAWVSISEPPNEAVKESGVAVICLASSRTCMKQAQKVFGRYPVTNLHVVGRRYFFKQSRSEKFQYMAVPPRM